MAGSRPSPARRWARLALPLLLVAAPLFTAACGSGDSDAGQSDGKIELRFSWWGSDTRHAYTQQLIELYESKHPDVTIKPDYSGFGDYWNKLATSVAAGNGPDVMQQETRYIREYADRGALADLTPYLGSTIADGEFDPAVSKVGELDGKTYAIPTGVNAYSIVADPAVLEAAGVSVPDDSTWTWEDLRDAAAAVTKGSPEGTYGLQEIGYYDSTLEIFARQQGLSGIYSADGTLAITKDVLTKWFGFIQSLSAAGATPPASLSVEIQAGGVDQSLLATGKGAMGGWWTNEVSALTAAAGTDLQLLRVPGDATTPGTYYKPAMFWSVGAQSEHPEQAAQFVDFLLNDPEASALIKIDRGMPVNLALREAVSAELSEADQLSAAFLEKIRPTIGGPAILPPKGAGEVNTILSTINEKVIFEKETPEEAADEFLQQAAAAIG